MLEFMCPSCGKRVQGDDSLAGKHVLCPFCNTTMAAPQRPQPSDATAIVAPQHAADAIIKPPATSFREGEPPDPLPPIRKEVPRIVMRWLPLLVLVGILLVGVALFIITPLPRVCHINSRTQSHNNLKQITLAFQSFHDANKRLPWNGTKTAYVPPGEAVARGGPARPGDSGSGSWAFQILPYIDQAPMFNVPDTKQGIYAYMCAGRGRPSVSPTGAWTDYMINPWLNDPAGLVDAPDARRTLVGITDGTSITIFVGHGNVDPELYTSGAAIAQSGDIYKGGMAATARSTTTNQMDTAGDQSLNWGGPFKQGALMAMGDGTVRFFPYSTYDGGTIRNGVSSIPDPRPLVKDLPANYNMGLGVFLTPNGGEPAILPDS